MMPAAVLKATLIQTPCEAESPVSTMYQRAALEATHHHAQGSRRFSGIATTNAMASPQHDMVAPSIAAS